MNDILLLALGGIGIGGFYGLIATGIVIGHKGSGLINLDQAALAMYPAYVYITMREEGAVYLPWFDVVPGPVDLPTRVDLAGAPASKGVAVLVGIMFSMLLGLAMQYLVFGPLRRRPAISKLIGSLGALLFLQSIALYHFGGRARTVEGIIPDGGIDNPFGLGGRLPVERIVLAAVAVTVGLGVAAYYRSTRTGLATRAGEDSEKGATLLGYSIPRLAAINWVLSTTITGMAGMLFLDVTSITPSRFTLFIVPALGAALLGNLRSPALAAFGGIAIGVAQSAGAGLALKPWWPHFVPEEGVREAIPLLVIVGFQMARGNLIPLRSTKLEERFPAAPNLRRVWPGVVALVLVVAYLMNVGSTVTQSRLLTSLIAAVLMLSSVVLVGWLGQVSLANLAFAGVAAYLATRFASDGTKVANNPFAIEGPGFPAPLAALFGIAVAVVVGLIVATPALRIRGVQLAVVTLAAAVAATELVMANPSITSPAARSNAPVPPPNWFGIDLSVGPGADGFTDRTNIMIFTTVAVALAGVAVANLRRGAVGRRFLAIRANERAASAVGIDVTRGKLLGFGIASAIAGVAGVLTAYQQTVLQITTWSALAGIANLSLLFLGGVGRIAGVALGAVLTPGGLLSQSGEKGETLQSAVAGAAMIAVAVFRPDGLVSLIRLPRLLRRRS